MSLKIEGRKCVVCRSYLFEDDDVVFCPECGAPHHRDCYKAIGKCGLGELHGTPEEYKYEPPAEDEPLPAQAVKKVCANCGREIPEESHFCPYCRAEQGNDIRLQSSREEDKGADIGGFTAGEIGEAVVANTVRYIPRFRQIENGRKVSWNWAAFLMPNGWLAFRKMYGLAAFAAAVMIAAELFTIPLLLFMSEAPIVESEAAANSIYALPNYDQLFEELSHYMQAGPIPLLCTFVSGLLNIGIRILCGLRGDIWYKERILSVCEKAKEPDDKEEFLKKRGSVNPMGFLIAVFLTYFASNLISIFLL